MYKPERKSKHSNRFEPYSKSEKPAFMEKKKDSMTNIESTTPAFVRSKKPASSRSFFPSSFSVAPAAQTISSPLTSAATPSIVSMEGITETTVVMPTVPRISRQLSIEVTEMVSAISIEVEPQPIVFSPRNLRDTLINRADEELLKDIQLKSFSVSSEKERTESKQENSKTLKA